jgi:ABC-type nickel/cobalt efflux system permease component RcnA
VLTLAAIGTGLLAGGLHVLTGPDHMAAVAPLAINSPPGTSSPGTSSPEGDRMIGGTGVSPVRDARAVRHRRDACATHAQIMRLHRPRLAWFAGLMWGVGHSGGTWFLAALALAFREALPVDLISTWSERLVGLVLIAVGLWGLHRVIRKRVHTHPRNINTSTDASTDSHTHTHPHIHAHGPGIGHPHGALGIGALHGLAGTSHLLGILPALALPSRTDAVIYVVAFGLGSIAAMTLFAFIIGLIAKGTNRVNAAATRGFMALASLTAIAVGIFWIYSATQPHNHDDSPNSPASPASPAHTNHAAATPPTSRLPDLPISRASTLLSCLPHCLLPAAHCPSSPSPSSPLC